MNNNNMRKINNKIGKDPYKGVRDFYPEDMFIQNYIFNKMRESVEKYGYSEYSASILEPTELYKAKTGDEIVNEQTYTFTDKGGRNVTLRPEMTPTIARMVAKRKREISLPIRWYSISNMFRYEKPQRGRLREHWQLNVDIFGIKSIEADSEIISIAYSLMKNFGAKDENFEIRINNRKLINSIIKNYLGLENSEAKRLMKVIDRRKKMSSSEFEGNISILIGEKSKKLLQILNTRNLSDLNLLLFSEKSAIDGLDEIKKLITSLNNYGVKNIVFAPDLMRGFDYYTGIVFEVFDKNSQNNRSLFGGGRYDDLLDIFGEEKIPAIGFGMGDVTIKDFLETYKLLPKLRSVSDLYICTMSEEYTSEAKTIAKQLRKVGIKTEVNLTNKKISDQMKIVNKKMIPFSVCIGENEMKNKKYKVKNMKTGEEKILNIDEIKSFLGLNYV